MEDFEQKETHDSYGMAGFYRVQHSGATPLFGSSLRHRDTIMLRIKTASKRRGISHDWYYGEKELIEVEMSKSQFADLITSMNQNDGIPVTIRHVQGKTMEECPYVNKKDEHLNEFKKLNNDVNKRVLGLIAQVRDIFENKKTLTKADKEQVLSNLTKLYNDIAPNAEYKLQAFQEQMDNTVTEAKGEIEAFFENKMAAITQMALVKHKDEVEKLTAQSPIDI